MSREKEEEVCVKERETLRGRERNGDNGNSLLNLLKFFSVIPWRISLVIVEANNNLV